MEHTWYVQGAVGRQAIVARVSEQRGEKLEKIRIKEIRQLVANLGRAFVRSLPFTEAIGGF